MEENEELTLPMIDLPTYQCKIPSTGKSITVKPFTVREEKLLLMAVESNDINEILQTTKQIVNNCIVKGPFDVEKMPFFDVDFLFCFLRAKSIGDKVDVTLTCHNNNVNGVECGQEMPASMDLNKTEVIKDASISKEVSFGKDKGVILKYPSYAAVKSIDLVKHPIDKQTALIAACLDQIYEGKATFAAKDYKFQQLMKFVEGLTKENYAKLEKWTDNLPTVVVKLEADCPKCGFHHNLQYSDFYDFFFS